MDWRRVFFRCTILRHFLARPRGVLSETYRYEEISLFPKDLNENYHPSYFAEKVVDPKSFRNILTSTLGWTVSFVLAFFLVVQLTYTRETIRLLDERQISLAQATADSIATRYRNLGIIAEGALDDFPSQDPSSVAWQRVLQKIQRFAPAVSLHLEKVPGQYESLLSPEAREQSIHEQYVFVSIPVDSPQWHGYLAIEVQNTFWLSSAWRAVSDAGLIGTLFDGRGSVIISNQHGSHALDMSQSEIRERTQGYTTTWTSPGTRNIAVIHAYVPVPDTDWLLVVDQMQADRDRQMRSVVFASGFLFVAALFGVFVIGFLASRPLSLSVGYLTDMIEDFTRSGRKPPVPLQLKHKGPTELLEIAERFAKVAGVVINSQKRLQQLNVNLEQEVARRTETLLQRNSELSALQKLLTPLNQAAGKSIEETIVRIREILSLKELYFVPKKQNSEPSAETLQRCLIPILAEKRLLGWLATSHTVENDPEALRGLNLLASSLGVVLSNQQLLQSIANQHRMLEEVFSSMAEGVAILDHDGLLLKHNDCLSTILGLDLPSHPRPYLMPLLKSAFVIRLAPGMQKMDAKTALQPQITSFACDEIYRLTSIPHATESERTLVAITFNIRAEEKNGLQPSMGIVFRDVSQDVQVEQIKDRLISVVAHELKTPITALRLQAETLATQIGIGEEERSQILQDMQDEAFRLRSLVDDWLDISRLEEGKVQLQRRIMHIATPIDRAAKIVNARYPITVTRSIDTEAECFRFDPERITQVFINLFNNAARYHREGADPCVHVTVTKEGDWVAIRVKDNGVGIAKSKMPYIFEHYFQADMSIARRRGGTGLGLAIVKGIVDVHGGTISVASEVGVGTEFTLVLPY